MKKFINKITALIITLVLSVGFFSGCDLITTDTEADMSLTIATIQLEGMNKEDIKKRQMVSAYNTTGYLYVYYYGYTTKQAYEKILEDLVNNRIIVQQSKQALTTATTALRNNKGYFLLASEAEDKTSIENALTLKNYKGNDFTTVDKNDSVDNFHTDIEYYQAKYVTLKSIYQSLESQMDKEEEEEHNHEHENLSLTPRTTLTIENEETPNEWELRYDEKLSVIDEDYKKSFKKEIEEFEITITDEMTKYDLALSVYKKYIENFDLTSKDVKKALNKFIKNLAKNGFITSDEASRETPKTLDELFKLTAFKDELTAKYEELVVAKLELALTNQEEKKIKSDEKLYAEYKALYETQKDAFDKDYTAYETALESASDSTFVVYNPNFGGKYGYVANLLIGFNDEQNTALGNFTEKVIGEKKQYRESLLKDLVAKDLRSTWVLSNYGTYDEETGKFVFGDDYVKTPELREYVGNMSGASPYTVHDSYDEEITNYFFKAVEANEVKFTDFYSDTVSQIMGFTGLTGKLEGVEESTIISKTINEETLTKFRDLIYAYSTDSGSLSENYGYVYSPVTSKSTYVKEFADAAERIINQGVGAYEVVATDYGYHIMLCTSVITPSNALASKDDFLRDVNKKGTLAYKFKEYKYNLISSTTISSITKTIVNTFKDDENIVKYNKSTYEDLIKEE